MAKFKLQPGEQLLQEGVLPYLKSKYKYLRGPAYLTDQRFVHANNAMARGVGGLLGALMAARIDLEIPLDTIMGISRSSFGRKNEPVLAIRTVEGYEHRIVARFEEWFPAFDNALATYRATRLVELEPGAWSAVRG
jgi:hypothetical protein